MATRQRLRMQPGPRPDGFDSLHAREARHLQILSAGLATLLLAALVRVLLQGASGTMLVALALTVALLAASLWLAGMVRHEDQIPRSPEQHERPSRQE